MTSTTTSNYGNGYTDISGTNYDWGVYNAIYNPKTSTTDAPGTWRTLTQTEWIYIVNTRSTTSGIRYAKAKVNGVPGLILVPDNWNTSIYTLNSTNRPSATFTSNIISSAQWITLENSGCVFLPVTGDRDGTSVSHTDSFGCYWSSSCYNSDGAYYMAYDYVNVNTYNFYRYHGLAVRLVRNVQ